MPKSSRATRTPRSCSASKRVRAVSRSGSTVVSVTSTTSWLGGQAAGLQALLDHRHEAVGGEVEPGDVHVGVQRDPERGTTTAGSARWRWRAPSGRARRSARTPRPPARSGPATPVRARGGSSAPAPRSRGSSRGSGRPAAGSRPAGPCPGGPGGGPCRWRGSRRRPRPAGGAQLDPVPPGAAASRTASPEPRSRSVAVARAPIESRVTMPRLVESCTRRWLSRTTGVQTADTSR